MILDTQIYFLILAIILFLGFVGEVLFRYTKIPTMLWLILFGIILGNFVDIDLFKTFSGIISGLALSFILFNSGLNINIKKFVEVFGKGVILTLINMIFSIIFVFIFLLLVFHVEFKTSLLISVILSGISSIVIIPLIQKLEIIPEKTKIKILLESTLTDILVIVISIALYQILFLNIGTLSDGIKTVFNKFTIGAVIGILIGVLFLRFNNIISKEEYPYIMVLALLFFAYFLSEYFGGNGGIAALFFGLTIGNSKHFSKFFFIRSQEIDYLSKHIFGLLTFLIVSFFFVYMGLFFRINDLKIMIVGLILSFVILLARITSINFFGDLVGLSNVEKIICSCLIGRGLSAGIMAFYFYSLKVFNDFHVMLIFSTVLFTILLNTLSLKIVISKIKKMKV